MFYFLALAPILLVILLMIVFRWGSQYAGPVAWLACCLIAWLFFGLNRETWLISQLKGLYLTVYVLLVIWPALFLYMLVNSMGGMRALVLAIENIIPQREILWLALAWPFSGLVEGLSGFGLPIAIVAPMLVEIGVPPVIAVAAVAVGHAWAVTFGSMGLGLQTLGAVTQMDPALFAPLSAFLLSVGCLGCGIAVSSLLGSLKNITLVMIMAIVMGAVYCGLTIAGFISLAAFSAGLAGILTAVVFSRLRKKQTTNRLTNQPEALPLKGALTAYGILIGLMVLTGLSAMVYPFLNQVSLAPVFPRVVSNQGFIVPAGPILTFRPLIFSGTMIAIASLAGYLIFRMWRLLPGGSWRSISRITWDAAIPTSIGILSMVGLSTMMDHCGMTQLLAGGLSQAVGTAFPLLSPCVGMLGTFTTGNNSNSNVLLAPLQKNVAGLLKIDPSLLISGQTAGGSLGSMMAPAKIVVGCGTVGITGKDGLVLRRTLPYGIIIGLVVGLVTWLLVGVKF